MPAETWKHYGPWYPTAHLRWGQSGKLEQIWRRNFEERHADGVVMGVEAGHEAEWREVPSPSSQQKGNSDAGT